MRGCSRFNELPRELPETFQTHPRRCPTSSAPATGEIPPAPAPMPRQPLTDRFRTPKIADATTALLRKNSKKCDTFYRPMTGPTLIRNPLQPLSPMPPELPGIQYSPKENIVCNPHRMLPPGNIDYNASTDMSISVCLCQKWTRHARSCSLLGTSEYRQVPRASPHFRGDAERSGAS